MREFCTGYRNLELRLPVTAETLFQIGSTTKIFNAALIMSLVEEGRLSLHTPVCEYLHNFRSPDGNAQKQITLNHLLSMTAGMDNGPYYDYGRGNDALARYVEVLGGIPHIFVPGTAFGYSNASTCVAGKVAANTMGTTWEQLLVERICRPLGLKHVALFAEDMLQHPLALGYGRQNAGGEIERVSVWSLPRSLAPAGSLTCSSAGDLVGLARMFLSGGKSSNGVAVLQKASIEAMQRPLAKLPTRLYADEWCLGPFRKCWGGFALYGHGGTNLSGSSMLLWCPDKNVAIATTVNVASEGYPLANAIFDVVFPRMFGINKPALPLLKETIPKEIDHSRYLGRFEAFGMTAKIRSRGEKLMLDAEMGKESIVDCELIPLGDDRFLPSDLRISSNRNWDIAVWGSDVDGRASHLLQGLFPLRRTA